MPGMMDTILDLGLTDATEAGLARVAGDAGFARDCHDRLRTMFRDIVGRDAPDDPWQQLRLAVEAVFRSWNSDRARAYRRREGIPDDAGTGVTIQAMVFGNRGPESATGVVFTRNPATGEAGLYGDVMFGAQGEDVVAGTHRTEPLASLDQRLPAVAAELRRDGARLEAYYRDLCDIEFTIEAGRLWLLQVRVGKRSPRAALRMALEMALDEQFPLTRREAVERVVPLLADPPRVATGLHRDAPPLATGLAASPGVATGEIVTNPEAAQRAADEGRTPILVRGETSPDDVHGMARAAGILTSRGGLASHAAVVARGWGLPAVVGARDVEVGDGTVRFPGLTLAAGDVITIDGDTGEVFRGAVVGATDIAPEARTLLDWARELGVAIPEPGETGAAGATPSAPAATPGEAATARRLHPGAGGDRHGRRRGRGACPDDAARGGPAPPGPPRGGRARVRAGRHLPPHRRWAGPSRGAPGRRAGRHRGGRRVRRPGRPPHLRRACEGRRDRPAAAPDRRRASAQRSRRRRLRRGRGGAARGAPRGGRGLAYEPRARLAAGRPVSPAA